MKNLFKNKRDGLVLLVAFLLVIAPMSLVVSHIDLLSEVNDFTGLFYTVITDSAGSSGFLFSLTILLFITWRVIDDRAEFINKLAQLAVILVIGFAAKTGLKHVTESPRPYTDLLAHQLLIPKPEHFYRLDSLQKSQVIDEISQQVTEWRTRHWQGEKDYSFPSGHTIFAAICLAFFGGIFVDNKRYALAALLGCWAITVAYSRLWLGMHRPIDLVGSIVFVAAVYAVVPRFDWAVNKLLANRLSTTH